MIGKHLADLDDPVYVDKKLRLIFAREIACENDIWLPRDLLTRLGESIKYARAAYAAEAIAALIPNGPHSGMIDLCCGIGCIAIARARQGQPVIAIDHNVAALKFLKLWAKNTGCHRQLLPLYANANDIAQYQKTLAAFTDYPYIFFDSPWNMPGSMVVDNQSKTFFTPHGVNLAVAVQLNLNLGKGLIIGLPADAKLVYDVYHYGVRKGLPAHIRIIKRSATNPNPDQPANKNLGALVFLGVSPAAPLAAPLIGP